jgi:hypothetical protein
MFHHRIFLFSLLMNMKSLIITTHYLNVIPNYLSHSLIQIQIIAVVVVLQGNSAVLQTPEIIIMLLMRVLIMTIMLVTDPAVNMFAELLLLKQT